MGTKIPTLIIKVIITIITTVRAMLRSVYIIYVFSYLILEPI